MTLRSKTNNATASSLSPGIRSSLMRISEHLYHWSDTCNVYVIQNGPDAVLIDFGDGAVLRELQGRGIARDCDILVTHHHRDQVQGVGRAVEAGAGLWVPHTEQDLFVDVEAHWQSRPLFNDYNVRQDLFSLLEPVSITGTLQDYAVYTFAGLELTVLPTPGHTPGSVSFLAEIDGKRVAFTGDLIAAPGKVWSLSATQWTYNGAEGAAASILSLLDLKSRAPDILLPSHGEPILDPGPAIDRLVAGLWQLLQNRRENCNLFHFLEKPYVQLTPHLLKNRTSDAKSYVLLSDSRKALLIDFGYDFKAGGIAGTDRASRRPWLYSLEALKRDYGVSQVDVVIPTHYHDDHVAGFNLLRRVEGTQVWAAENFSAVLESPSSYDLPCLWYDPIPVDRIVPLDRPVRWEEYEITLHALPGHTLYAVALTFEVDGKRVLAPGDQYQGEDGLRWNYVYRNRFQEGDYRASAALYRQFNPDLILPGHWEPFWVEPGYLDSLEASGQVLEQLHKDLLVQPPHPVRLLWVRPYQAEVPAGETLEIEVDFQNDSPGEEMAFLKIVLPTGWLCEEEEIFVNLDTPGPRTVKFRVTPPGGTKLRRARVAIDLTIGNRRYGQQAVMLVNVI
jgi:glyoxylase-like metal-dependent hydrolase (beta-lactamase superfamily II)